MKILLLNDFFFKINSKNEYWRCFLFYEHFKGFHQLFGTRAEKSNPAYDITHHQFFRKFVRIFTWIIDESIFKNFQKSPADL